MEEKPTIADIGTLRSNLRALPRPVWVLFFGTFVNKFGTFVIPFLTLYLVREGFSLAQAGIAIGAYGVGDCVACLVGGYLADNFGRRRTIILSNLAAGGVMLLLSQARSFEWIVLLAAGLGLAAELYRPASAALLADLVPPGQRVAAFSAYRMAFNAGWAFGPAMAGFLAAHSYFWLFAGDAITSFIFAAVAWQALPRTVPSVIDRQQWRSALARIRQDGPFLRLLVSSLAVGFILLQMGTTFGLHLGAHGHSPGLYGMLLSLNGALVVLCELPLSGVTRRLPPRPVIAAGYLLIALGFSLNGLGTSLPWLVAGIVIFTLGEMVSMPVASAFVADLAPVSARGGYLGIYSFIWGFALVFGPSIGLFLFEKNRTLLWSATAAAGLLAAVIVLYPPGKRPVQ